MTFTLAALFLATVAAVLVWRPPRAAWSDVPILLLLVGCYAVAARVQFEVGFAFAVPTQVFFVPMLLLASPSLVPVLVASGFFFSKLPEHIRGSWHPSRIALHLVSAWYAVGPALVLGATGTPSATLVAPLLVVLALAGQFAFDFAASAARGYAALGIRPSVIFRSARHAWLVDTALTPIGIALAVTAAHEGFSFLLGLPLLWLLAFFARERKARIDHALELSHAYRGTAFLLGDMVEADNAYTGLHSQDVVTLVLSVSNELGLDAPTRQDAEFTALLHDVGKIKIPNEIINKPGPLTDAERGVINTHTIEGQQMLERVGGLLGEIGKLVRSCHENWDGSGYPDGLAGEEIPLIARIVSACDAFSAMTTDRSYRKALPADLALRELERCRGSQFDPLVADAIVRLQARAAGERLQTAA